VLVLLEVLILQRRLAQSPYQLQLQFKPLQGGDGAALLMIVVGATLTYIDVIQA